ncbi:MAG: hypothetical protein O2905_04720 [Proteobacteria bacterium]|nr:hypothetical protein [Pseudomonadota bacterium]
MKRAASMGLGMLLLPLLALGAPAAAQDDLVGYQTAYDYQLTSIDAQVGYTTGMIDMFLIFMSLYDDEDGLDTVIACLGERSQTDVSILYDTFLAANPEMVEFAGAEVFMLMMFQECFFDQAPLAAPPAGGLRRLGRP